MTDLICPNEGQHLLSLPYAEERLNIEALEAPFRGVSGDLMAPRTPLKYTILIKTQEVHDGLHMTFLPGQRLFVAPRQMLWERIIEWPHMPARKRYKEACVMTPDYRHHAFQTEEDGAIILDPKDSIHEEGCAEAEATEADLRYRLGYRPLLLMQVTQHSQRWDPKQQRHTWEMGLAEI